MSREDFITKKLIESRTLILSDGVSSEMMESSLEALDIMDSVSDAPIKVLINSPGGEAYSGLGLYDALRSLRSPVVSITNGLCASAGILVLLAAEKERRFSYPHSRFMIHQPSGGAYGQGSDMKIQSEELLKIKKVYFEIIAERCSHTYEDVENNAKRDQWLGSQEAKDYNLVSHVVNTKQEINNILKENIFFKM